MNACKKVMNTFPYVSSIKYAEILLEELLNKKNNQT